MKEFINKVGKKTILIMGVLMILILSAGTYAWFSWSSSETSMSLTVGDINGVSLILTPYKFNSSLAPSLSYENNDYVMVTAENKNAEDSMISLYYIIDKMDMELINSSFKYTILRSIDDGNTFSEYTSGDFSNANTENNYYLFQNEILAAGSKYLYKVYIWIDGNMENNISMQKGMFEAELNAEIFAM